MVGDGLQFFRDRVEENQGVQLRWCVTHWLPANSEAGCMRQLTDGIGSWPECELADARLIIDARRTEEET